MKENQNNLSIVNTEPSLGDNQISSSTQTSSESHSQTSTQIPTSPNFPTTKKSFRLLLLGGVILIIFTVISSIFFLQNQKSEVFQTPIDNQETTSPTPDPATDWKTYINDKYNYSVKHPNFVSANSLTGNDIYLSYVSFEDPTEQEDYKFSIRVRENSLDEEVNLIKNQILGHVLVSLESEKRFTKNGFDGIRLDFVPIQFEDAIPVIPFTNIILHNEVYSYTINASTKYIDQILSTFEFIE